MRYTKAKKVGKKKFNQIVNEEINKIEAQRPSRVKRNGVELNAENQAEYIKDKEELSALSSVSKRPLSKQGRLKTAYFDKPCIYMLYNNDKIVYIGQTECLARRISEHIQSTKEFDSFVVHSFVEDEYIRLKKEKILIRKYKPALNVANK